MTNNNITWCQIKKKKVGESTVKINDTVMLYLYISITNAPKITVHISLWTWKYLTLQLTCDRIICRSVVGLPK